MNSLFTRFAVVSAFLATCFGVNAQSISSTLNNRPGVVVGVEEDFTLSHSIGALPPLTSVRLKITLANPAQSADVDLSLSDGTNYNDLVFDANGVSESPGVPYAFIPNPGQLKVTFSAVGTYNYSISIINDGTSAVIANADESVVVANPPVAPTISSTLDGQSPFVVTQTDFDVTTTAGSQAGTLVRVRIQLDNAAQAGDVDLSYETAPGSGTFAALPLDGAGMAEFGPGTGFPLADATTAFRVTFDAPGTYDYTLTVFDVATNDTLAQTDESVTAADYIDPTISSDLDGQTVTEGDQTDFDVTTTAGSEVGTLVRVRIQLDNAAQAGDVNLSYETAPGSGTFTALPLDGAGMAEFGPGTGFPLADATTAFRVTFDAPGTYDYILTVFDMATNDTLAQADESVTVDAIVVTPTPSISSDLDGRTGVTINDTEDFTVTTDADGLTGVNVRIQFTLDTPTQANDMDLRFHNPVSGNLESLTFDANGVAYAGAATGFPIADDAYDFTVEFLAGGTYGYTVALVEAGTNNVLADNDEEVVVIDNSGIDNNVSLVLGAYPNPTENLIRIQTKEDGLGTVDVFTVTGSKVLNQPINGSVNTVSLGHLTAGVYVIRVAQAGSVSTLRVVKK